ncbi:hypothetical protein CTA2_10688 [Colletotrichum tanaceti]|nr:hypothetical protein CTA2_10688 [Colletotrichum tanaceti]
MPVLGAAQHPQTAIPHQSPHPGYTHQPVAPLNDAYPNTVSHAASQQYPTATPSPSGYPQQSPTTGQNPNWSSTLQQTSSLFSTNTQRVLGSYQDIKSKARAKFTQYLAQPASQPRPAHSQAQSAHNQSPGYPSTPLISPVSSATDSYSPGHATSQYQYGVSPASTPTATAPAPVGQYVNHYATPVYGQSPTSETTPSHGPGMEHGHRVAQQPAYSHPVTMPPNASLNYHPTMPPVNTPPAQHDQSPVPTAAQQGAPAVFSASPAIPIMTHPSHVQEPTSHPPATVQTLPESHAISVNPLSNIQTPSSVTGQEPNHYQAPPQPLAKTNAADEPARTGPEEPNSPASEQVNRAQPAPILGPTEDNHQVSAPQPPALKDAIPLVSQQGGATAPAIEHISHGVRSMSLHPSASPREAPWGLEDEEFHEWKRPIPKVADDGQPNDIIWECPEQRELDYEADWYRLASAPDFLVCTRCREMYLSGTPLAASLERARLATGRCRFNVPRITRLLLPEYLKHGDEGPIREFMSSRPGVPDCRGQKGARGGEGIGWFKPLDGRLEGVVSCEACFEDVVLATSLRHHFVAHDTPQPADATWTCDVSLPFVGRSLVKHSRKPVVVDDAWEGWVQAAAKHMSLPRCEKKPVSSSSRRWVRLRGRRFPDLKICERCYEETIALTALDENFETVPQEPSATGLDWMDVALGYRTEEPAHWSCGAAAMPVYVSIAAAKSQRDIGVLYKALEVIVASPACTEQGIAGGGGGGGGAWYTLRGGGCDGYMLCAACHAAYVGTWQLDRLYQRVEEVEGSRDGAPALLCSFQRSAPRWLQHMYRMQEGIETGVWSRYAGFVRKFDGVPECAREEQVPNRRWYGWDDCTICPECYVTFCKESSSSPPRAPGVEMDYDNQAVADLRMCCMYSPRMRGKWTEACASGDAGGLVEFSRARHGAYQQTVLRVKMLRRMQEMQMMNAMHAGLMSVTYQGIEGLRVVSGTTDGYEHGGGGAIGWHATAEGATSAAFRNQMQAGMSQANSAGTWVMMAELMEKWREFE